MTHKSATTLHFQQLQAKLAQHIRDPENSPYFSEKRPGLVKNIENTQNLESVENAIEPRRLEIYQNLFYNNVYNYFRELFSTLFEILGEARFQQICREFMQKHQSKTPLFHELGIEFLTFLQTEFTPLETDLEIDPAFILELAHFQWAEAAVGIEPQEGPLNPADILLDWQTIYQLSPVAWPLMYEWPVHQITRENASTLTKTRPDWPTALLIYRDDNDEVQTLELTPVLFELLTHCMDNQTQTAQQILETLAEQTQQPIDTLKGFAQQILQNLLDENILTPLPSLPG